MATNSKHQSFLVQQAMAKAKKEEGGGKTRVARPDFMKKSGDKTDKKGKDKT